MYYLSSDFTNYSASMAQARSSQTHFFLITTFEQVKEDLTMTAYFWFLGGLVMVGVVISMIKISSLQDD